MFWRRRKPEPPAPPQDCRVWNEDWKVGDTAECVVGFDSWHRDVKPWHRPARGQRFTVVGFCDGEACDNTLRYFLRLSDWPKALPTVAFRKVRPIATDESEVVNRILNAPQPGKDRLREDA